MIFTSLLSKLIAIFSHPGFQGCVGLLSLLIAIVSLFFAIYLGLGFSAS